MAVILAMMAGSPKASILTSGIRSSPVRDRRTMKEGSMSLSIIAVALQRTNTIPITRRLWMNHREGSLKTKAAIT